MLAHVHPGAVWGTANMGTPPDGSRPTMNMGLVTSTNRHTALDADVVFHEYTHGLTNRLVGGAAQRQLRWRRRSRGGMGEGWSDYFACIALGKNVVGDWVVNRPTGIRRFRYDDDFPDTYADLGTGRYAADDVHSLGELWCAVLMSRGAAGRRLGVRPDRRGRAQAHLGQPELPRRPRRDPARRRPARPRPGRRRAARPSCTRVWEVFARYGMGPGARTDGADVLTGIVADFELRRPRTGSARRARRGPARGWPIPDDDPSGVVSTLTLPDAGDGRPGRGRGGHHPHLRR